MHYPSLYSQGKFPVFSQAFRKEKSHKNVYLSISMVRQTIGTPFETISVSAMH